MRIRISLLVALACAGAAHADVTEFNFTAFRAASGGDGTATVEGARPLISSEAPFELRLIYFNEANPVRLWPSGATRTAISRRIGGVASVSVHVWERLSIAAQLPVVFTNHGDLGSLGGVPGASPSSGLGDLRLIPRYAILRREQHKVDLAVQASMDFGTGAAQSLASDRDLGIEALLAAAYRIDFGQPHSGLEFLANAYLRIRYGGSYFGNIRGYRGVDGDKAGPQDGGRLAMTYFPGEESPFLPHKVFGEFEVSASIEQSTNKHLIPMLWHIGAQWCVAEQVGIDLAYSNGRINEGWGEADQRVIIGLGYLANACATMSFSERAKVAGGAAAAEKERVDAELAKKAAAEAAERKVAEEKAQAELAVRKAAEDKAKAEGAAAAKKAAEDKAKAEEAARALADRDHDGVPDTLDNCPDNAGTKDNSGCPAAQKQVIAIANGKIELKERVEFTAARAVVQKGSFSLLNQVAALLKAHPEVKKVQVEGHTDKSGLAEANLKLSQQRADAVVAYLVKQGIAKDRLEAKGLGASRPLVANDTRAHKEQNRRVELHIVP